MVVGNNRYERADVKIGNTIPGKVCRGLERTTANKLVFAKHIKSAPVTGQNALTSISATLSQGVSAGAQN